MFQPLFSITPAILKRLNRIEVIKEKLASSRIHPREEYRLKREALISMVHHSTAIEGNTLNERQIDRVLQGKSVTASAREIHEVKNYKKALDWIGRRESSLITEKEVLKIHALAMANILRKERTGHFRQEPVYVVSRTPISYEVRYTGPDHKQVLKLVKALCRWINQVRKEGLSPILIAGAAHAEIAAIHPFVDGNGRTARLLATLILYTEKYDFRKLFALENFYNTNRPAYYEAIHLGKTYAERQKSQLTHWLDYFVKGFLAEMELVLDKIRPLLYLKKASHEKLVLSRDEIQILDFIQEIASATSKDVQGILSVTPRTAQRALGKLIAKKLLRRRGGRKNARYVLAS